MVRTALFGLALGSILFAAAPARADVNPDPCAGKAEGDACVTAGEEPGTCTTVDGGLECVANSGTGGAGPGGGDPGTGASSAGGSSSSTESDSGCSVRDRGTQRGMSAFAVLAAVGVAGWLARRRRSNDA